MIFPGKLNLHVRLEETCSHTLEMVEVCHLFVVVFAIVFVISVLVCHFVSCFLSCHFWSVIFVCHLFVNVFVI